MELQIIDAGAGVRRIVLTGQLDSEGVGRIETRYAAAASGRSEGTIVDLSGVTFLASLGIRMLVSSAKSASGRGGRTVLLRPQPLVARSLRDTGIDRLIPIAADEASAIELLAA